MSTLYVIEQGARVEKEYRRIAVFKDDELLLATPLARVDHVVLVGNVGVTTPALVALLEAGVGLSLVNQAGRLRGRLTPAMGKHLELRRRQFERAQDVDFCLALSKDIVRGKLRNARNLAHRLLRSRPHLDARPLARLEAALAQIRLAPDLPTLRGVEGNGAKAYFAMWRQCLDPGFEFDRRTRRPPRDPVNALLSLGYSLLSQNVMAACEVAGLDPYEGFYHADKYGRPALALDLMEEFRGVIADSVALNLINRGMLQPKDFQPGPEGGVYLKPEALRTYFHHYTARLQTPVIHPLAGRALSYQKIFEVQARQMRKVIEGEAEAYEAFLTR